MLEAAPILAAFVVLPLGRRLRAIYEGSRRLRRAIDPVDALVVYVIAIVALYMNRLPIRVQITVRYLHTLYPVAVYGVFRLPRVRSVLTTHDRPAVLGYEATVLLGTPVALWLLLQYDTAKGDVVQTIGTLALVSAAGLAASLLASRYDERAERLAAVSFGVAAGSVTLFVLLMAFVVMHFGPSTLPFFEVSSAEYRWATLTG